MVITLSGSKQRHLTYCSRLSERPVYVMFARPTSIYNLKDLIYLVNWPRAVIRHFTIPHSLPSSPSHPRCSSQDEHHGSLTHLMTQLLWFCAAKTTLRRKKTQSPAHCLPACLPSAHVRYNVWPTREKGVALWEEVVSLQCGNMSS